MRFTPIPIADTMNFENPGGTLPPQQQKIHEKPTLHLNSASFHRG